MRRHLTPNTLCFWRPQVGRVADGAMAPGPSQQCMQHAAQIFEGKLRTVTRTKMVKPSQRVWLLNRVREDRLDGEMPTVTAWACGHYPSIAQLRGKPHRPTPAHLSTLRPLQSRTAPAPKPRQDGRRQHDDDAIIKSADACATSWAADSRADSFGTPCFLAVPTTQILGSPFSWPLLSALGLKWRLASSTHRRSPAASARVHCPSRQPLQTPSSREPCHNIPIYMHGLPCRQRGMRIHIPAAQTFGHSAPTSSRFIS